MDDSKRRDQGDAQRRKVLGNAWVDKSAANRTAFNADFLDLITRYAWGEIWTRPRFDERTRRVPIIFVTAGSADSQRRFRGYEAGAVDFIQKPIEADILRSKADVFLELYKQRQQIAEQRDRLELQSNSLQEADRRKDEFLATLAHELRNPLAPLRHGLDILRSNPDSKAASNIRDMMDRQLTHLVRLIDDLLDVSRISQGKIELRKEQVNIQDIVESAV